MVTELLARGEITEPSVEHHYVTFLAGIFRSVRFGAASAHGRANMVRFNYFLEQGAFTREEDTGKYRVDFAAMREAVSGLSELILTLQGAATTTESRSSWRSGDSCPRSFRPTSTNWIQRGFRATSSSNRG